MKAKLSLVMASLLATISVANAEVVVVVNAKNPASSLTAAQVADIYLGKDSSYAPVDLPDSAQRNEFYTKVAGKDNAQVKAIWARLVFTGKSQPPKEVGNSADAVKHVAGNDKGIAYVDKSAVDGSVKVVLTVN
jgi:ABC-type phosphate transport system substrate-binding protein